MTTDQAQPSFASTKDGWKQHPEFSFIRLNQHTGQVLNTNTGNLIGITRRKGKRPSFTASVRCAHSKAVRHTRNLARAILLTFVGPAPTRGHEASHLNHDPSDCRLENLAWETRKANLSRRTAPPDGALHHHSKLDVWEAYSIYRQYHLKLKKASMGKLAKEFKVSKATVQQLVTGKTWMSYQAHFAELVKQDIQVFPDAPTPTPEPVRVIRTPSKPAQRTLPPGYDPPLSPQQLQITTRQMRSDREQAQAELALFGSEEAIHNALKAAVEAQAQELADTEDDVTPAPAPTAPRRSRFAWDKAEASQAPKPAPAPAPAQTLAPQSKSRRF
jgi:hypothetical protein